MLSADCCQPKANMSKTRQIRYIIFLKDVMILALTCFGGPQVHLTMFLDRLVKKHNYITEAEIMELQALCQILPGPTSTQTITAIGFRLGGPNLAYLTLLVWIIPFNHHSFYQTNGCGVYYFCCVFYRNEGD